MSEKVRLHISHRGNLTLWDMLRTRSVDWDDLEGKRIEAVLDRKNDEVTLVLEDE